MRLGSNGSVAGLHLGGEAVEIGDGRLVLPELAALEGGTEALLLARMDDGADRYLWPAHLAVPVEDGAVLSAERHLCRHPPVEGPGRAPHARGPSALGGTSGERHRVIEERSEPPVSDDRRERVHPLLAAVHLEAST